MTPRKPWYAVWVCALSLLWVSCDQTSNVGGGLIPDRNRIESDTVALSIVSNVSPNTYTGDLTHLSFGSYADPRLGELEAVSLILPGLMGLNQTDTLTTDSTRVLLNIRPAFFYGDTLRSTRYGIFAVNETWRPSTFRSNTRINIDSQPIVTFEVSNDSLLRVELPASWLEEYKNYVYYQGEGNRDSNYVRNYHGLALVGLDEGKLLSVRTDSTYLIFENPRDTTGVNMRARAYWYDRTPEVIQEEVVQISSNLEHLPKFEMELDLERLKTANITRAELIIHLDEDFKNTLPEGHVRPATSILNAYNPEGLLNPEDVIVLPPSVIFLQRADRRYEADVTDMVRRMVLSAESKRSFYLSIQPRSGVLHNELVVNAGIKAPKLVLKLVTREGLE